MPFRVLAHAAASSRGRRSRQEDAYCCVAISRSDLFSDGRLSCDDSALSEQMLLLGVFDGHGGDEVSRYVSEHVGECTIRELRQMYTETTNGDIGDAKDNVNKTTSFSTIEGVESTHFTACSERKLWGDGNGEKVNGVTTGKHAAALQRALVALDFELYQQCEAKRHPVRIRTSDPCTKDIPKDGATLEPLALSPLVDEEQRGENGDWTRSEKRLTFLEENPVVANLCISESAGHGLIHDREDFFPSPLSSINKINAHTSSVQHSSPTVMPVTATAEEAGRNAVDPFLKSPPFVPLGGLCYCDLTTVSDAEVEQQPCHRTESEGGSKSHPFNRVGSTASLCLVSENNIDVVGIGDSRSILFNALPSTTGKDWEKTCLNSLLSERQLEVAESLVIFETSDHRPTTEKEARRLHELQFSPLFESYLTRRKDSSLQSLGRSRLSHESCTPNEAAIPRSEGVASESCCKKILSNEKDLFERQINVSRALGDFDYKVMPRILRKSAASRDGHLSHTTPEGEPEMESTCSKICTDGSEERAARRKSAEVVSENCLRSFIFASTLSPNCVGPMSNVGDMYSHMSCRSTPVTPYGDGRFGSCPFPVVHQPHLRNISVPCALGRSRVLILLAATDGLWDVLKTTETILFILCHPYMKFFLRELEALMCELGKDLEGDLCCSEKWNWGDEKVISEVTIPTVDQNLCRQIILGRLTDWVSHNKLLSDPKRCRSQDPDDEDAASGARTPSVNPMQRVVDDLVAHAIYSCNGSDNVTAVLTLILEHDS